MELGIGPTSSNPNPNPDPEREVREGGQTNGQFPVGFAECVRMQFYLSGQMRRKPKCFFLLFQGRKCLRLMTSSLSAPNHFNGNAAPAFVLSTTFQKFTSNLLDILWKLA